MHSVAPVRSLPQPCALGLLSGDSPSQEPNPSLRPPNADRRLPGTWGPAPACPQGFAAQFWLSILSSGMLLMVKDQITLLAKILLLQKALRLSAATRK